MLSIILALVAGGIALVFAAIMAIRVNAADTGNDAMRQLEMQSGKVLRPS